MDKNCKTTVWKPAKFNLGRYSEIGKLVNSAENSESKDRKKVKARVCKVKGVHDPKLDRWVI